MPYINNPDVDFSFFSGFRFKFTVNGKELLYLASAWTGKERIVYGGQEISRKKNYNKKTSHNFLIDNIQYKITLTVDSLLKGGWRCCLLRNDSMVKCFDLYFKQQKNWISPKQLLYGFIFGFLSVWIPKSL